jgi:hypothetical protein
MLRNPVYAGWITSKKRGVTVRGRFVPIIGHEVFDAVQRRLGGSPVLGVGYKRDHPDFPLRRFIRCALCGAGLTASNSRRRDGGHAPQYRCYRGCGVTASRHAIEGLFRAFVERLQPDRELMAQLGHEIRSAWKSRTAESRAQAATFTQRIDQLKNQYDKALELLVNARIAQRHYDQQVPKWETEIKELENAKLTLAVPAFDCDDILAFAERILPESATLWQQLPPDHKRRFQAVLFPQGVIFDGEKLGTVETCFGFSLLPTADHEETRVASPTSNTDFVLPEIRRALRKAA